MAKSPDNNSTSNKRLLVQYATIGAQILAGLVVFIFGGKWIDGKIHLGFPIFIWLLPLIFIIAISIKAIKDTSNKK
jgi:hypothetical protein